MWISSKKSFEKVFNRRKEAIEINSQPSWGMVFVYGESEDQKLDGYGVIGTAQVSLWLLSETRIEVGDVVTLRGKNYRVVEVKEFLGIAKKVVLEKAEV